MGVVGELWTYPRRALARTMEFAGAGTVADAAGWIPQFTETFFGPHVVFWVLVCMGASMIFDLFETVLRPETWPPPCVDKQRKLPLEEEK